MLNFEGVTAEEFVEYKGKPIVRQGDDIFYGDLSDKYYVHMIVMGDKKSPKCDAEIPGQILVQLIESSTKAISKQKPVMGLAEAFEYAEAWLNTKNK